MKEVQLTKSYVAYVDDEDFEYLSFHKWHVLDAHPRHRYAARWKPGSSPRIALRMHHVVLGVTGVELTQAKLVVDHIDRNGLNNQKENLRIVTRSVNAINSDKWDAATGVHWDNYRGKFKAMELPSHKFIGWFNTREEALKAKGLA